MKDPINYIAAAGIILSLSATWALGGSLAMIFSIAASVLSATVVARNTTDF